MATLHPDAVLDPASIVERLTKVMRPPLVPEIRLRLAADAYGIFQEVAELPIPWGTMQPFWAFAWPGGQALARYILDHPALVAGRTVVDVGSGSGLGAIAAMLAGARSALAADIDPLAAAAASRNGELNGVEVAVTRDDLLGTDPSHEVILIGDLVYLPELNIRVTRFLESASMRGVKVLVGDRTTARRPAVDLALLAEHHAPVTPLLEETHLEDARVWELTCEAGAGSRR